MMADTGFLGGLTSTLNPIAGAVGSVTGALGTSEVDSPPGDMSSRSYGTFNAGPKIVQDDKSTTIILIAVIGVLAFLLVGKKHG